MTLTWILETTLRTVAVTALAGVGLALFQVRSSTVKLAVWRLVLFASLLMPLVNLLPKRVVQIPRPANPVVARMVRQLSTVPTLPIGSRTLPIPVDWRGIALRSYALVAGLLALRTVLGLLKLRHLGFTARPMPELGPEVFETAHITVPVTYGVFAPRILLPEDWRHWTPETLGAVLAHERSHITERDFLTQFLSKLNRAIYWANPLAWWLDQQLAQFAEQTSDDAAINRVGERPAYAALLLDFAQRGSTFATSAGVSMARPGAVSGRIDRILDEAYRLSTPLSSLARVALAAVAIMAVAAFGALRISTVSAQTRAPEQRQQHNAEYLWNTETNTQEWALVTSHGTTAMNIRSDTKRFLKALTSRLSGDYLWFRRDGKEFVIDDPSAIAEIQAWFKPMEELGSQQGELGQQQEQPGKQMELLGNEMAKLSDQMAGVKVNVPDAKILRGRITDLRKLTAEADALHKEISVEELASLQNRLGEMQELLGEAQSFAGEKQSRIGELHSKLGERQSLLGEKQGKLGELQGQFGERQGKIVEQAEQRLRSLIDQAVRDGRAKPVR